MTDMQWLALGFALGVPVGAFLVWFIYLREPHDAQPE